MRDGQYQILTICTGNICRSPMAEGLIRARLSPRAAEFATVGSAGTAAVAGVPASLNSVEACRRHDIDIRSHRSRPVTPEMIDDADLILVMEEHHRQAVLRMRRNAADRTHLITEFARETGGSHPGFHGGGIEDPIGQEVGKYLDVFRQLDDDVTRAMPLIEASVARAGKSA